MKRLISTLAAIFALHSLAASVSASGYYRAGVFADLTDATAANSDNDFAKIWYDSKHFGGSGKARLDVKYTAERGGVILRYESYPYSENYFPNSAIKRAMGYASLFDGALILEGGKLYDRFTAQTGDAKSSFGSHLGARAVLHPVSSLYLALQASDYNAEYDTAGRAAANKNLLSASAKYTARDFFLTAGAHFSGIYYGCAGLTAVDGLTLTLEIFADYGEHYSKKGVKSDAARVHYTKGDLWIAYDFGKASAGCVAYWWAAADEWFAAQKQTYFSTVNPYVKYAFSPLITLQLDGVFYLPREEGDFYATATPAIVFAASSKADATLFLKISTDTDITHHTAGAGIRYRF